MGENLDLLGDPIPENWGKRGRPPHVPTEQNRLKIRLLLALDWPIKNIAAALRITQDTLRKYYFVELRAQDEARAALEGWRLLRLYEAGEGGNVGALKEIGKILERKDIEALDRAMRARQASGDKGKPQPKGKKEQAKEAAESVGGIFATPPAPELIN